MGDLHCTPPNRRIDSSNLNVMTIFLRKVSYGSTTIPKSRLVLRSGARCKRLPPFRKEMLWRPVYCIKLKKTKSRLSRRSTSTTHASLDDHWPRNWQNISLCLHQRRVSLECHNNTLLAAAMRLLHTGGPRNMMRIIQHSFSKHVLFSITRIYSLLYPNVKKTSEESNGF